MTNFEERVATIVAKYPNLSLSPTATKGTFQIINSSTQKPLLNIKIFYSYEYFLIEPVDENIRFSTMYFTCFLVQLDKFLKERVDSNEKE